MDVVFCRNVIIYFDKEAKKKVIESFYEKLREGGYLLLGHSESLINISNAFALRTLKNDMVYQKLHRTKAV
jgi:chemotaxis protein methyltransferase CheR